LDPFMMQQGHELVKMYPHPIFESKDV